MLSHLRYSFLRSLGWRRLASLCLPLALQGTHEAVINDLRSACITELAKPLGLRPASASAARFTASADLRRSASRPVRRASALIAG